MQYSKHSHDLSQILKLRYLNENNEEVPITEEFLREQHDLKRAFFSETIPLDECERVHIYDALVLEKKCEAKRAEIDSRFDFGILDPVQYSSQLTLASARDKDLKALRDNTDKLMRDSKPPQRREEWGEEGERWRRAHVKRNPDRTIYERLKLEDKTRKEIDGCTDDRKRPQLAEKLRRQTAATDAALESRGSNRGEWLRDGANFLKFQMQVTVSKLERLYRQLLQAASARTLELRELKSRATGLKQATRILKAIQKRYPVMDGLIKAFNKTAERLPAMWRPDPLSFDAFKVTEEAESNGDTADDDGGRNALFHLHMLRAGVLDDKVAPYSPWGRDANVRRGIATQLRRDRALEELVIVKQEWHRNCTYLKDTFAVMLDYLDSFEWDSNDGAPGPLNIPYVNSVCRMMWEELQGIENMLKAEKALNNPELMCPGLRDLQIRTKETLEIWMEMQARLIAESGTVSGVPDLSFEKDEHSGLGVSGIRPELTIGTVGGGGGGGGGGVTVTSEARGVDGSNGSSNHGGSSYRGDESEPDGTSSKDGEDDLDLVGDIGGIPGVMEERLTVMQMNIERRLQEEKDEQLRAEFARELEILSGNLGSLDVAATV